MSRLHTGKQAPCGHCKTLVYIPRNRFDSFQYCSRSCKGFASRVQITANCETCGDEFTHISSRSNKAKYCGKKCYNKSQRIKGSISCECKYCGKTFLTSPSKQRIYCSIACVNKPKKDVWIPAFKSVRKNMLTRGLINTCERCGYDAHPKILGVHHKDRNRNNNDMSNLEVLCPNCHSLEHMKHIEHGFTE